MARARPFPLLLVALAALAMSGPASAQNWFQNLFGGSGAPPPRPGAPAYPGYGGGYRSGGGYRPGPGYGGPGYNSPYGNGGASNAAPGDDASQGPPRRHAHKKRAPSDDAVKEAQKPAKNATVFVDVFGDSLGQMLADGLDDALADRPDVGVVHKAKGSSGLVATDFFDWPKTINELLAGGEGGRDAKPAAAGKHDSGKPADAPKAGADGGKEGAKAKPARIDVAVMMIGSNDKQAIRENGQTLSFGTPEWTAAYTRRVMAIDEAFRSHGVPLIWVGLPITKDDTFADAMASLNDITREAAAKTGAIYVDTWEAFSDDKGDFSSFGPDVNGQTVRLRSADGVHFTKAGARKLAHFVVAHVLRALEGKTPAPQLPTADTTGAGKTATAKPDAGPVRNLSEAPESKDGTLAALPGKDEPQHRDALVTTTLVRGEAVPIPAGRADDARWPTQGLPEP